MRLRGYFPALAIVASFLSPLSVVLKPHSLAATSIDESENIPKLVVVTTGGITKERYDWLSSQPGYSPTLGSPSVYWQEHLDSPVAIGDTYSFRFCGHTNCEIRRAPVLSVHHDKSVEYVRELYKKNIPGFVEGTQDEADSWWMRQVSATVGPIPSNLGGESFTLEVARGANPTEAGWSQKTSPTPVFSQIAPLDSSLPSLEIGISGVLPSSIEFGWCINRTNDELTTFDPSGFMPPRPKLVSPRGQAEITSQEVGQRGASLGYTDLEIWGDSLRFCTVLATTQFKTFLTPGKTYLLTVRISSSNRQTMSSSVEFTVPGGCPSRIPTAPRHTVPSELVVIDDNRFFARKPASVLLGVEAMLGTRVAPVYVSSYKTQPTSSRYEYLPAVDDWALHLDATTIGSASIQKRTVFASCSRQEVNMLVEVRKNPISGDETESACRIVEGEVQVTRVGICTLRVIISPALNVSKSSLENPFQADLYYIVDNLKSDTVTTTTTDTVTTATTPVLVARNKSLTVGKSLSAKQLSTLYKLPADGRYTVVANSSGRTCQAVRGRVVPLRTGTCTLVLTEKKRALSYIIRIVVKRP